MNERIDKINSTKFIRYQGNLIRDWMPWSRQTVNEGKCRKVADAHYFARNALHNASKLAGCSTWSQCPASATVLMQALGKRLNIWQ